MSSNIEWNLYANWKLYTHHCYDVNKVHDFYFSCIRNNITIILAYLSEAYLSPRILMCISRTLVCWKSTAEAHVTNTFFDFCHQTQYLHQHETQSVTAGFWSYNQIEDHQMITSTSRIMCANNTNAGTDVNSYRKENGFLGEQWVKVIGSVNTSVLPVCFI